MADRNDHEGVNQFKTPDQMATTPLLKDLYTHITPRYAADWKVIGTLLGLLSGELKSIEAGYPTNVRWCCNQMLEMWLEKDPSASWKKVFGAIESPAVSSDQAGTSKSGVDMSKVTDQGIYDLSNIVSRLNVQARFVVDDDTWPPDQPKSFTPLLLISYKGLHNEQQDMAITKMTQKGDIGSLASNQPVPKHDQSLQEVLGTSTVTKELEQILAPLEMNSKPQFILVEGPPGIGKSVLLKEIAYRWGDKQILKVFKLVLLVCLRDPIVQEATSVSDLLQLFCIGHKRAPEITEACHDHLFLNGGKNLVLLLDGFDELPAEHHKQKPLVLNILHRRVLPECGLIVSSRPHASEKLRIRATLTVNILGFTETERVNFIKQALPHAAVEELTEYLESNLTINGLCFIPFNMVILIYLYKQRIPLPKNSAQLYNHFICLTICRHHAKSGYSLDNTITDLDKLPEPYNTIVQQLSKLSLEGLNNSKLIFTLDEMKAACPDIETIDLSGFGLLQAVPHIRLTGKTMTFNFVHFSIQEFLAAYHITQLPPDEELRVLNTKFWSDIHSNMFAVYTSLTKGQRPAFKQFLTGGKNTTTIAEIFLKDQLKCLRLFRCFCEANDEAFCTSIQNGKTFNDKVINLEKTKLTVYDVECVTLFLTCSPHKKWKKLNLYGCHIQDHGFHVLFRNLMQCDVMIANMGLAFNDLTKSSSSSISDLAIHCRVEVLWIRGNETIGEDPALYHMLSNPSSRLVRLGMRDTNLSFHSAIDLFTALAKGNKLQWLLICNNFITNEACDVIATTLKSNTSLVRLDLSGNSKIGAEAAQNLVQTLQYNNTLVFLFLPVYSEDVKRRIRLLQEEVNKNRESRGHHAKLKIDYL